jgi:hypothetical protein
MKQRLINQTIYWVFLVSLLLPVVSGLSGDNTTTVTGSLLATTPPTGDKYGTWEDTQWQFFSITVESQETLNLTLDYQGDLDLDLILYVDEQPGSYKKYAWDISHCQLDNYPYDAYSGVRTKNTASAAPERIMYLQNSTGETKIVYVLVYVYDGLGNSSYTLTANKPIHIMESDELEKCWLVIQAWAIFAVGCVIFSVIFIKIVKRATMTPEQKAELRAKEEQKKQAKKGKDVKERTSMANRKATPRR